MKEMSVQRKKVAVMAASVTVLASMSLLVLPGHLSGGWQFVRGFWLGLMVVLLVKVFVDMAKLKKEEG
jgi:hypothetical protein